MRNSKEYSDNLLTSCTFKMFILLFLLIGNKHNFFHNMKNIEKPENSS